MSKIKTDFTACIAAGGDSLRLRLKSAAVNYSPECKGFFEQFDKLSGKEYEAYVCGFLLLDGLFQKNRVNRSELVIVRTEHGRPFAANRSDLDFCISWNDGCVLSCLALGDGEEPVSVGSDLRRDKGAQERISEICMTFMDDEEMAAYYYSENKQRDFYTAWTHHEAHSRRTELVDEAHMVRGITPDKSASSEHGNNAERANTSVGNTSAGSALAPEKSASSEHGNNAERADTSVGNTSAGTALAPEKSAEATAEKQRDVYSDGTIYVCGETYYYCINTFEDIPETAPEEAAKQEVKA
jgi:hypothetical protein